MMNLEETTRNEWLNLELDGELDEVRLAELSKQLEASPELRKQRAELHHLHEAMEAAKEPVEHDFHARVMDALPAAGWEARPLRNWAAMIGLFVLLGGSAAAIMGTTAAGLAPESAFGAALLAVADLFRAAVVTGAGFLGASWKGAGLAVGEWLEMSWGAMAAFGIIVAALNVQLYRMVRRRRRLAPSIQRELDRSSRQQQ